MNGDTSTKSQIVTTMTEKMDIFSFRRRYGSIFFFPQKKGKRTNEDAA